MKKHKIKLTWDSEWKERGFPKFSIEGFDTGRPLTEIVGKNDVLVLGWKDTLVMMMASAPAKIICIGAMLIIMFFGCMIGLHLSLPSKIIISICFLAIFVLPYLLYKRVMEMTILNRIHD